MALSSRDGSPSQAPSDLRAGDDGRRAAAVLARATTTTSQSVRAQASWNRWFELDRVPPRRESAEARIASLRTSLGISPRHVGEPLCRQARDRGRRTRHRGPPGERAQCAPSSARDHRQRRKYGGSGASSSVGRSFSRMPIRFYRRITTRFVAYRLVYLFEVRPGYRGRYPIRNFGFDPEPRSPRRLRSPPHFVTAYTYRRAGFATLSLHQGHTPAGFSLAGRDSRAKLPHTSSRIAVPKSCDADCPIRSGSKHLAAFSASTATRAA